jgi:hypothetical protein
MPFCSSLTRQIWQAWLTWLVIVALQSILVHIVPQGGMPGAQAHSLSSYIWNLWKAVGCMETHCALQLPPPELLVLEPWVDVVVVVVKPLLVLEATKLPVVVAVVLLPPVAPVLELLVVGGSTTTLPPQAAKATTAKATVAKTKFFIGDPL